MAIATVLQLSDTHFTESPSGTVHGLDPVVRLQRVLASWEASGQRADLVVLTGDNADDGSTEACRRLAELVVSLGAPVLAVSGNHDLAGSVREVFGDDLEAEVGTWHIVGLSSERPGRTEGTLDVPAALARLDRLDDRPTVVALHHPPSGPSTHQWFQLAGADELLTALAARPHVRAVISGHLHEAFDRRGAGGLALLGAPSTLYAVHHDGERWERADDNLTGARALYLADDGTLRSELVRT
jgi:Icc protein